MGSAAVPAFLAGDHGVHLVISSWLGTNNYGNIFGDRDRDDDCCRVGVNCRTGEGLEHENWREMVEGIDRIRGHRSVAGGGVTDQSSARDCAPVNGLFQAGKPRTESCGTGSSLLASSKSIIGPDKSICATRSILTE